jgi:DNA-binding NarL/FixJ family response regulator
MLKSPPVFYMTKNSSISRAVPILIVDDHPVVRRGLAMILANQPDFSICGDAAEGSVVLGLIDKLRPGALILDLNLKDMDGIDLLKDIHGRHPKLPVLVLSMHDELIYAERALRAGAKGYVNKEEMLDKVLQALRQILKGEIYASESVKAKLMKRIAHSDEDRPSTVESLSDRELEVFNLLGQGFSSRAIAERWHRSVKTVDTYRAHIKEKLGLANSSELVREAVKWVQSKTRL